MTRLAPGGRAARRCCECLSEDVTVKVIDLCGFEHWFCAEDWAANEAFRAALADLITATAERAEESQGAPESARKLTTKGDGRNSVSGPHDHAERQAR